MSIGRGIRQWVTERRAERALEALIRWRGHRGAIHAIQQQVDQVEASDLFTSPSPPLTDENGLPTHYAMSEIRSVMEHDEQLAIASERHRSYALRNSPTAQQVAEAAGKTRSA